MNHLVKAVSIGVTFFFLSCSPYVITTPLEHPLRHDATCAIGDITDALPQDMSLESRPSLEEINRLKDEIDYALADREIFAMLGLGENTDYAVEGRIIEFKRGSGTVRFFIGFGLGNARLVVSLKLVDRSENKTIFSGNFRAEVSDWATKGDVIYKSVAANFAKALKKELDKIKKNELTEGARQS
jgi:hypothetical protein